VKSLNLKYTSLIKIIIQEENFKWHLEAFASELFICIVYVYIHPKYENIQVFRVLVSLNYNI